MSYARKLVSLMAVVVVVGQATSLLGATLAMTGPGTNTGMFNPGVFDYTAGFKFTVGDAPLSVTSLGLYDVGNYGGLDGENNPIYGSAADGLDGTARVAIWDAAGTQLAGALVTLPAGMGANQFINGFRFQDLVSPVLLSANTDYVIGFETVNLTWRGSSVTLAEFPTFNTPLVSYVERQAGDGAGNPIGFAFPQGLGNGTTSSAWEANFLFNPVPEPASGAMLISAVAWLFLVRGRKKGRG
jgi:hypothetical protein